MLHNLKPLVKPTSLGVFICCRKSAPGFGAAQGTSTQVVPRHAPEIYPGLQGITVRENDAAMSPCISEDEDEFFCDEDAYEFICDEDRTIRHKSEVLTLGFVISVIESMIPHLWHVNAQHLREAAIDLYEARYGASTNLTHDLRDEGFLYDDDPTFDELRQATIAPRMLETILASIPPITGHEDLSRSIDDLRAAVVQRKAAADDALEHYMKKLSR